MLWALIGLNGALLLLTVRLMLQDGDEPDGQRRRQVMMGVFILNILLLTLGIIHNYIYG